MKKIAMAAAMLLLATAPTLQAQKALTEGKLVYEITPDEGMNEQYAAFMPKESVVYFKGDMSRVEMSMGMGMSMFIISDAKTKETTTCQTTMKGEKVAVKSKMGEEDKEEGKLTFKKTDETKMIAGYKCMKAVATDKDGNNTDIWYTKDIKIMSEASEQFKELDGYPLEYNVKFGPDMGMTMSAKTISAEKVDKAKFDIPSEYKVMTQEEMMKQYQGGGH